MKDVNVSFTVESSNLHILRDVSLQVPRGSFLCIVGESGCGKSVTAQAIVHNYVTGASVDVYRVRGTFTTGTLRGKTSSAAWGLNTVSDTSTMDNAFEDIVDNNRIETESDSILDFTEHNPFGEA